RCGRYEVADLFDPNNVSDTPFTEPGSTSANSASVTATAAPEAELDVVSTERLEFRNGELVVVDASLEPDSSVSLTSTATPATTTLPSTAETVETPRGPVIVDEEAGVIVIETNQPIPAESTVAIVMSGVKNPRSPNLYRFSATLNYPAFGPRTVGFWLVEIQERSRF
ncbi:MAG: DUF2808 domain-containing protein, partial [Cyanobacteria bacterium P01_H01_bin.121]